MGGTADRAGFVRSEPVCKDPGLAGKKELVKVLRFSGRAGSGLRLFFLFFFELCEFVVLFFQAGFILLEFFQEAGAVFQPDQTVLRGHQVRLRILPCSYFLFEMADLLVVLSDLFARALHLFLQFLRFFAQSLFTLQFCFKVFEFIQPGGGVLVFLLFGD